MRIVPKEKIIRFSLSKKSIYIVCFVLFISILGIVADVSAKGNMAYTGPNRSRVVRTCVNECQSGQCNYRGSQSGYSYTCRIFVSGSTSAAGCPNNPGGGQWSVARCGWPSGNGGVDSVTFLGWSCSSWRSVCTNRTVTDPPATISASVDCSQSGSNGWCQAPVSVDFSASDPLGGNIITSIEGNPGILCGINASSGSCTYTPAAAEGTFSLNAWALTSQPDSSYQTSVNYKVDTVAPTITGNLPAANGANGWYSSPVVASVSGSDATAGIASLSVGFNGSWQGASYTISTDGTHDIQFRGIDSAGWVALSGTTTINYDGTAPTMSPAISGFFQNGAYGPNMTFTVNGADSGSGIASEQVRIDGGSWEPAGLIVMTGGNHTVEFRAVDSAGNVVSGGSQSFLVDNEDPVAAIDRLTCVSNGFDLSGDATDNVAVASVILSVDGRTYSLPSGAWTQHFDYLADGSYQASLYVEDAVGYSATVTRDFSVDNLPPEISLSSEWNWNNPGQLLITDNVDVNSVQIKLTDSMGLNKTINFNGGSYPQGIYWANMIPEIVRPIGFKVYVEVLAFDNCGNKSSSKGIMFVPEASTATPTSVPAAADTREPKATNRPSTQEAEAIVLAATPIEVVDIEPGTIIQLFKFTDWGWVTGLIAMIGLFGAVITQLGDPRPLAWIKLTQARKETQEFRSNRDKEYTEDN